MKRLAKIALALGAVATIEAAIQADIQAITSSSSVNGEFYGRVIVNGTTVEYRAFALPDGRIDVGTYYKGP
jgi:hypothetical protein